MVASKKTKKRANGLQTSSIKLKTAVKKISGGALLLQDGSYWPGVGFGSLTTSIGECVFNTAHSGYQEVLTDPSYYRQILIFSSIELGNQGFHEDDFESSRLWAAGCVARDQSLSPYHWRKSKSLEDVLKENRCPGLSGVDTRRLILHLRSKGNLWGVISSESDDRKALAKHLEKQLSMEGLSLTSEVSTKLSYHWIEASRHLMPSPVARSKSAGGFRRCVVMDFGVKRQILRYLIDAGFSEVIVVPAKTKASEIKGLAPETILLSNGPGDPAADSEIIEEVRTLLKMDYPTLGICLGHQILGLALGLQTYKLKFGHHGANHPVKNLLSDRVEITSHNHGFAVADSSIPSDILVTHRNLNDGTLEGFRHRSRPIYAIQFHPESSPGPMDSTWIFQSFQQGFQG